MSSTLTSTSFIKRFINNCPIVKSTRLDKTIKAIINNYSLKGNIELINYLNKLRIIYYLKRLEYKDSTKAKAYKGISTTYIFSKLY